jgi:hypothetical protein
MPSKNSTRAHESARRKTSPVHRSAIGGRPSLRAFGASAGQRKAVVAIAVWVMAGGIMVGARQAPRTTFAAYKASAATAVQGTAARRDPPVTLIGCLERSGESFRLKDASGAEASKTRRWTRGFLKKDPATIDVVDRAHTLKLADHVGRRVSVTGPLVDREMQARSLRRVASSCLQQP